MSGAAGERARARAKELDADHALLMAAVREAGDIALGYFRDAPKGWEKAPGHLVSEADLAAERRLAERLRGARPDYGWLSEESEDEPARLEAARVWLVDPIDGTRSFLEGLPEFAVAGALVVEGRPVAAAIYNPATDEFFDARAGGGARCQGAPITVSRTAGLDRARLLSGRTERREHAWAGRFPESTICGVSSIAYKLALVASGRYDALISVWPKHEWDIGAGELLVAEAGGAVSTAAGAGLEYNRARPRVPSCVASNGILQAVLLARLAA